ncbi:MAG: hypothetical protein ACRYG5_14045 [Janthinobacterium lividum]
MTQATEPLQSRESLGTDLTKLAVQFDAQQHLLVDYRTQPGIVAAAG